MLDKTNVIDVNNQFDSLILGLFDIFLTCPILMGH